MTTRALLLLVHQARSFVYVGQLAGYARRLGLACVVVSSRAASADDLERIRASADRVWVLEADDLDDSVVRAVLPEVLADYAPAGVLATFEGYRVLMAELNRQFDVADASPSALASCMDKLACRTTLSVAGLSRARAERLDGDAIQRLRSEGRASFIKPIRGIGSFACFRLDDSVTIQHIETLQAQMRSDAKFKSIFGEQFGFFAEDYIDGDEYSFEVLVADGDVCVVGVHAKFVGECFGTTLEMANSLPAAALDNETQRGGERFIADCLRVLGLDDGAYHIETRYDPAAKHWEIIEINTRMGGALINQSVEAYTGGWSFLELWTRLLCTRGTEREETLALLRSLRESERRSAGSVDRGVVFMSRYCEPGRTVAHISAERLDPQPDIIELLVVPGARLPAVQRGIFALNAMWKVSASDVAAEVDRLGAMLDRELQLDYIDI